MRKLVLTSLIATMLPVAALASTPNKVQQPSAKALAAALKGYKLAESKHDVKNNRYMAIVDFDQPSYKQRFFIYDLKEHKAVYSTLVAQGKGSGTGAYATKFSNQNGTHASSLGVFVTTGVGYGHHGQDIHVEGLQKGINDNAAARAIEIHSAWYVNPQFAAKYHRVGNSFGCFAMSPQALKVVTSKMANGGVVVASV